MVNEAELMTWRCHLCFFEACCVTTSLSCLLDVSVLCVQLISMGDVEGDTSWCSMVPMSSYQVVTLANSEEHHRNGNCITEFLTKAWFYSTLLIVGNSNTSLIAAEFVSSIHILSMPKPIPPVGGIPISRAFKKSSSV